MGMFKSSMAQHKATHIATRRGEGLITCTCSQITYTFIYSFRLHGCILTAETCHTRHEFYSIWHSYINWDKLSLQVSTCMFIWLAVQEID
jgi:hypothetical protein